MLFSTALKKSIASALVLVNLAYPITATAGQYMGTVSVKDLVVTNGELPPVVNIDTSNNSSGTFRAGSAVIKVAPGTIAFGITEAGKRTAEQTVTLSNIGGATAQLGTLSADRQFSVTKNCDGVTLPPLGTCLVNIAYAPTQVSNLVTSTVLVPFSSGTSSAQAVVHVSGSSTMPSGPASLVPVATITEAPAPFGLALINQQSLSQTFNLRSTGSTNLELKSVKILGDNESFKVSSACEAVLAPGASCPITVTFEPLTVGAKSAQVELDTNAFQKNTLTLPLTGEAIEVFPIYGAASTSSVDFGDATIAGAANIRRTVKIANSGTAGLQTSFALAGSHIAGVSIANNNCHGGLAAGGSCTLELVLDASAARVALGQLVVTHDGKLTPTSPVSIPFSGEVLAQTRVLSYSPTVVFGNVDLNTPAVQTVSITNLGNSSVTGVSATVAAPFSVTGSTCEGLSLVPGGGNSCVLTISLTHSTTGPVNRAGTVTSNGLTSTPAPLALSAMLQQRLVSTVTPAALNFGLTSSLTWSDSQTVQVTNTGTVRVSPRVASRDPVTGQLTTSNWIRVATDTCTSGIEPGASCSFDIQVKPASSNSASATVTVYPDEGMSTQGRTFSVTAQGNPQSYQASTGALAFGTVGSLQTIDRSITFTNTSAEGISVTGFTQQIVQPVAGNIALTSNTCGTTLAPGANCTATYRFSAPSSTSVEAWAVTGGSVRAYFSGARASAEVFEANVSLVGSAVTVANDGTDFGATPVGRAANTASRKTATVTNTGAYPVRLAEIGFGENSLNLVIDSNAPSSCASNATLNAGQSCVVTTYPDVATYTGTSGAKSATLNIPAADRNNPAKVLSSIEYTGTLTPVTLSSEVAALDFGVVGENTQNTQTFTFTVSHGGGAHLTTTVAGAGYSASSTCPTGWVAAGTTCTVSVTVQPGMQQGNLSGVLTVLAATEGISKPMLVTSLFSQVEAMSLSIEQNGLSFGDTPAQTPGLARYAVIKNTSLKGIATLTVGSVNPSATLSLARSDSTVETYDYAGRTLKTCAFGTTPLHAGEMCFIKFVTTSATGTNASIGAYSGTTQVSSNTSQGALTLALSANFLPADLTLSANAVTFETPTPSASAHAPDKVVSLTNTGLGRLWLADRSMALSGDYYFVRANGSLHKTLQPAAGAESSLCELRSHLEPGQSCEVTLRFVPSGAAGVKSGTLTVNSTAPGLVTKTVSLSGTALAAVVYVNTAIDMGKLLVGDSVTKSFVIGNGGNTPLLLANFARGSTNNRSVPNAPADFTAVHNCPTSLNPGVECVVNITFTPDQNRNWTTTPNKETFGFSSFTNGSWQESFVNLHGEGYGADLTSDTANLDWGQVETGAVDRGEFRTITYTASGDAPVRVTQFTPAAFGLIQSFEGGSCVTGLTLQPGQSCTVLTKVASSFAYYEAGNSYQETSTLLGINGSYYVGSTLNAQKAAKVNVQIAAVAPPSVSFRNPSSFLSSEETSVVLTGTNFRPGITAAIAGQLIPLERASNSSVTVTIPAGLPVGPSTITLKNTDAYSVPVTTSITAMEGTVISSPLAQVFTVAKDSASRNSNESVLDEVVLENGNRLALVKASSSLTLRLLQSTGEVLSQTTAVGTPSTWYTRSTIEPISASLVVDGSTVKFASLVSEEYRQCSGGDCSRIMRTAGVIHGQATLGASSLSNATYGNIAIVGATASDPSVTGNVAIGSNGAQTVIAYQATLGSSYASIRLLENGTLSSTSTVSSVVGVPSAVGVALNGNNAFVRHGNKIRTFDTSASTLSAQAEYVFAAELASDSGRGLVYSEGAQALATSCYAGTVLCLIPAIETALGSAEYLAGSRGTSGYVDGNYLDARLAIESLSKGAGDLVLLRQASNPKWLRAAHVGATSDNGVQITATSADFGSVNTSSQQSATITLTNSGTVSASLLSAPAVSGANSFSVTGTTCAQVLIPGESCSTTISFAPVAEGLFSGTLSFDTNFGVINAALSGAGVANPAVAVSTAELAFEGVLVSTSSQKTITLTNTGNVALQTFSASLSGAGFSSSHNCPATLNVSASCTVTVTLSPTARVAYSGDITVGYNLATAQVVHLSGQGQAPALSLSSSSESFGTVAVGGVASKTVTLVNSGNVTANLSYGNLPTAISRFSECGNTLAANSSCAVTLTWAPVSAGSVDATLSVSAHQSFVSASVTGTAVQPYAFSRSPSSLDFGTVQVPNTATRTLTITNTGANALSGGTFLIKGSESAEYSASADCPTSLEPGASCTVSVTLTADRYSTTRSAYLQIAFSNTAIQNTSLGATVLAPSLIAGGVKSFGSVAVGSTATASWTLTNTGNLAAPLTFTPASLPSQVTRSGGTCSTTLNAGTSCSVILKFTPTSTATVTGALPVSSIGTSANMSFIGYGPVVPAIALSTTALNWGTSVAVGSSASQSIVLTNTGNIDLTNPSITITGNLTEYTATSNCPTTLPAGDSCTINVEFAPTSISGTAGSLTAAYAGATSKSTSLAGTGQGALALGFSGSGATLASNDFGAVAVGSNLARSQTFYNNSSNQIATFEWGPLPSYLTRSGTCTTALAVNANCTIILTYRPTSVVQDTASYTFSANGKQFEITNVGRGTTTQQATLTPNALAFGTVSRYSVNTLSTVFKNTGTGPITNPQFAITGLDSFTEDYSISHDCPLLLPQGDSCNIAVTYSPQNYVGVNAVLSASYAGTPVTSASLTQTLVTPALSVVGSITPTYANPTATELGVVIGATVGSATNATVQVYNIGTGPSSFGISGDLDSQVAITGGTCLTGTVTNGNSCTLTVTFTPTRAGNLETKFLVSDAYTTLVYTVKGVATAPAPAFALNKTTIAFGGVPAGSAVQDTVTVTNTGSTHLSTINVAATGYDFSVDSTDCPATLMSGASCNILVNYVPVKYAATSGSLSVKFNGAPAVAAKTVAVTGSNSSSNLNFNSSATAPSIFSNLNAGTTGIGATVTLPALTVYNTAAAGATANFSYGALPTGWSLGTGTCNSGVLAANSSCTVILKYTASDRIGKSDQFVINAPNRTLTINLNAFGTVNASGARTSSVSATSLNFGAVPVGTVSAPQSVVFTNTSAFNVSSPSIAITAGTNAADFSMTTDCGETLAAGASCNVSVQYRPSLQGGVTSSTATLSLNYATLATKTVSLSGASAYASLSASPGQAVFNATTVGVARTLTFTMLNATSPTSTSATTLGLNDSQLPPEVTRTGGTCTDGISIAAGGSCTIQLTYLPTSASAIQGSYLITSSAGHNALLSYSGSATQPSSTLTLSTNTLAFGDVPQGTDGGTKTLMVTNSGAVEVSYPSITMPGSADTQLTHNCPVILAPAESCFVNVTATPKKQAKTNAANSYGVLSGFGSTISISYFGAPTVSATVSGRGTATLLTVYTGSSSTNVPTIKGSLDFGTVALGASVTDQLNLANGYLLSQTWYQGGDIGPITYSDDFPEGITREGTCGETLNKSTVCSLVLRLTPTQIGDVNGVLKIEGTNSPVYIAYSGTVVAQSASNVSTSAIAFGAKEMGTTTTQSFVVSNTGLSPISNPSVSYTGNYTNYSVSTDCPMTLNPGELCNVNVTFAPRTTATTNLSISVKFNNTALATVTVSGTPLMTALSTNGSTGKSAAMSFPAVVVGGVSVATITVYNNASATSPATLQLGELPSTIVRTGGTCGDTLEPGANCNITFTHTPDTLSMTRGKLTISSQFGQSIEYTYTVTPSGAPSFSISTANMAFGSNPKNSTSEQTVTITNSGKLPMTNPSAVVSGNVAEYSVTNDCPLTLGVDETCEAVVTFMPTTTTGTAGTLTLGYTGATSRTVALTGVGY